MSALLPAIIVATWQMLFQINFWIIWSLSLNMSNCRADLDGENQLRIQDIFPKIIQILLGGILHHEKKQNFPAQHLPSQQPKAHRLHHFTSFTGQQLPHKLPRCRVHLPPAWPHRSAWHTQLSTGECQRWWWLALWSWGACLLPLVPEHLLTGARKTDKNEFRLNEFVCILNVINFSQMGGSQPKLVWFSLTFFKTYLSNFLDLAATFPNQGAALAGRHHNA